MSAIARWMLERLERMPVAEFESLPHRRLPEACAETFFAVHVRVPLSEGEGSAVLAIPSQMTPREDRFVLMLHGMGDDSVYPLWPWIQALTAQGLAVLSVDWDGHGYGGSSTLSFDRAPHSVGAILGRLFEETPPLAPLRACIAVGFSTGAALALAAAAHCEIAREHLASIVAVSPAVAVGPTIAGGLELLSFASPDAWRSDLTPASQYYGRAGLIPAFGSYRRSEFPIRLEHPRSYPAQVRSFADATFGSGRALRLVEANVLWIHGTRDRIIPYAAARARMAKIRRLEAWTTDRGHLRTAFSGELAARVASHVSGFAPFLAVHAPSSPPPNRAPSLVPSARGFRAGARTGTGAGDSA